jgi:hypothetical protein
MKDFDKILLKPNIDPIDSNTQRIRRNLIVTSVIAFFFVMASSGVDIKNSSFAGIKFYDLNGDAVLVLILLSLIYFLVHFIWASSDYIKENRFRLTGVAIPMVRGGAMFASDDDLEPNVDNARQSSMCSWWQREKNRAIDYQRLIDDMKKNINNDKNEQAINALSTRLNEMENKASYITEALQRFESGFWKYQVSQLLRWTILDFGLPVIIGCFAFLLICLKLIGY